MDGEEEERPGDRWDAERGEARMDGIEQYDYDLPKELIAQQPVTQRSDARLMIVDRATGELDHAHVRDLGQYLRGGDQLVVNDSRVVPACLTGCRIKTGGRWQGLFLDTDEQGNWRLLCKTRGKMEAGERVRLTNRDGRDDVRLTLLARMDDGMWAARPDKPENVFQLLQRVGRVPLPPYIRGGRMVDDDLRWYQTVYADRPGSVAAPTAGLHLTELLLRQLGAQRIGLQRVTLHVGMGTFRPIAVSNLDEHKMHSEWGEIQAPAVDALREARAAGGRVVAVGTTSVRVLESAAAAGTLQPWSGHTDLFIRPGFRFHATDALLTNFHLPRSSLLVLVSAFAGRSLIQQAYREAVRERYRFFSYGDAMLIR